MARVLVVCGAAALLCAFASADLPHIRMRGSAPKATPVATDCGLPQVRLVEWRWMNGAVPLILLCPSNLQGADATFSNFTFIPTIPVKGVVATILGSATNVAGSPVRLGKSCDA